MFANWAFGGAGNQTITVINRGDTTRRATSNSILVNQVVLSATISPTSATAGEPILTLTIEARDSAGNLVSGYRGGLDIIPSTSVSGLEQWGAIADYTFSAANAGRMVITNWGFNSNGAHTITVIDRADSTRRATSNVVTVAPVHFVATISPLIAYVREQDLSLVVEVLNSQNQRVSGYRGEIDINPSGPTIGLYQSPLQGAADYGFSADDGGRHVFANWGFNSNGAHTITVIDLRVRPTTRTASTHTFTVWSPAPDPNPSNNTVVLQTEKLK